MEHSEEIKQAWGKYYEEIKFYLDDEGWFCKDHFVWMPFNYEVISSDIDFMHCWDTNAMIPKSIYK